MAKYNRITKRDIETINNNLRSKPARERAINVLNYLKFHIEKNNGELCKSFAKMHKAYKKSNLKFSLTTFKNIINRLHRMGLIGIKAKNKTNVYYLIE
ncbi:hypothetical protein I9Y31_003011 [Clostridium perfringens]|nr:hypothetical protein [Clostridium perfringens]